MKVAMKARSSAANHYLLILSPPSPSSSNFITITITITIIIIFCFLTIFASAGPKTAAVISANSTKKTTAASSSSPATDLVALLAVKASLRDPHGVLSSWKSPSAGNGSAEMVQCTGDWVGVRCSRDTGRVIALHLPSKGLGGTLATEIGFLHSLRCLSLHDNAIAGPIPTSISALFRLRALYLFHNLFTGSIPPSLPPSLHSINLANNRLRGTIPSLLLHPRLPAASLLLRRPSDLPVAMVPRLQALNLSHNQLTGPIPPQLAELPYLRVMDLSHNLLHGSFPLAMASSQIFFSLRALDLSHNGLTGALPDQIATEMASLVSLDLSDNNFSGPIPSSLGGLSNLTVLDISHNSFHGNLPPSMASLSKLSSFNCSFNNLTGEVPKLAHSFDASSFEGNNAGLCGFSASSPCPKTAATTGESSPLAETTIAADSKKKKKAGFHVLALVFLIIGIVIAVLLAMCACSIVFLCCFGSKSDVMNGEKASSAWQRGGSSSMESQRHREEGKKDRRKQEEEDGDGDGDGESKEDRYIGGGKLVHFEGSMGFGSEDLLCATAEIVGKSTYGTVYKAAIITSTGTGTNTVTSTVTGTNSVTNTVTGTNTVTNTVIGTGAGTNTGTDTGTWNVAVKRLRDGVAVRSRREFEAGVRLLGGVGRHHHPNLLPLRAYYWGPNAEKLLIFDFMSRGNLASYLLHSHSARGPDETPMPPFTWRRRVAIAAGAARGLAHLHDHEKMVHGNLSSTNILLDSQLVPKLSDFGLSRLMTQSANSAVIATAGTLGYRAPELTKMKKATPKSDVYSFGIVLLELLTGKTSSSRKHGKASSSAPMDLPDWVASLVKKNEWSHEIFDAELVRSVDGVRPRDEDLIACLQLAMACVKISPRERPDMAEVVRRLEELSPGQEQG